MPVKTRYFFVNYESNRGLSGDLAIVHEGHPSRDEVIKKISDSIDTSLQSGEIIVIKSLSEFKNKTDFEAWIKNEKDTEDEIDTEDK